MGQLGLPLYAKKTSFRSTHCGNVYGSISTWSMERPLFFFCMRSATSKQVLEIVSLDEALFHMKQSFPFFFIFFITLWMPFWKLIHLTDSWYGLIALSIIDMNSCNPHFFPIHAPTEEHLWYKWSSFVTSVFRMSGCNICKNYTKT